MRKEKHFHRTEWYTQNDEIAFFPKMNLLNSSQGILPVNHGKAKRRNL